jgi:DNA gyrase/topoisomerase IV subunit B
MCKLHAGGKFDKGSYKVSGGLHGVGVSCVNALSEWLEVEVNRNNRIYEQTFRRGVKANELKEAGTSTRTGTKVTFKPDATIFETLEFSYDILSQRLRELAFLMGKSGVEITLPRRPPGRSDTFRYPNGSRTSSTSSTRTRSRSTADHQHRGRGARRQRHAGAGRRSRCSTTTATARTCSASSTTSTRRRAARTSRASAAA